MNGTSDSLHLLFADGIHAWVDDLNAELVVKSYANCTRKKYEKHDLRKYDFKRLAS